MNAEPKFVFIAPFVSYFLLSASPAIAIPRSAQRLTSPITTQQQSPSAAPAAASSITIYPDTAQGLRQQIEDTLAAIKGKDKRNSSRAINDLILPDAPTWFADAFGVQDGERLASDYESTLKQFEGRTTDMFRRFLKDHLTTVEAKPFSDSDVPRDSLYAAVLRSLKKNIIAYDASTTKPGDSSYGFPGPFFHVQGKFRLIEWGVFSHLSGAPPLRIRIGGQVAARSVIHQVYPAFPPDARQNHLSGIVLLHVIIATDGKVKDVAVLKGDPVFVQAAVEAVKQWIYKPYLLDGKPVEVDTQVQVVFRR